MTTTLDQSEFEGFFESHEPRLRRALVAAFGIDRGSDALSEALGYAWEHRDRVCAMEHPVPYLFRVGQSKTRRRKTRVIYVVPDAAEPWIEPGLPRALAALSERQRVVVVLVHGFGWQLQEVAELLDVRVTTVQNHLERGLAKLRHRLETP
ncbi:MAG: sigma factor-like helix-turn-helix DNA-binding protein [Acidimicrobiia bacterium]